MRGADSPSHCSSALHVLFSNQRGNPKHAAHPPRHRPLSQHVRLGFKNRLPPVFLGLDFPARLEHLVFPKGFSINQRQLQGGRAGAWLSTPRPAAHLRRSQGSDTDTGACPEVTAGRELPLSLQLSWESRIHSRSPRCCYTRQAGSQGAVSATGACCNAPLAFLVHQELTCSPGPMPAMREAGIVSPSAFPPLFIVKGKV